jgi:hypothetical protein
MGDMVMVMGDLVVLHTEVPDVVRALSEGGINITAVRRHLLRAEPFPLHVHVEGIGDATQMAAALKVALEVMATSMEPLAAAGEQPRRTIGTADIEGIIGREGTAGGASFRYSIPRAEEITACRMTVPNPLGLGIANNFQPIGEGRAAITGDFVLVADEVNPVVAALRRTGSK